MIYHNIHYANLWACRRQGTELAHYNTGQGPHQAPIVLGATLPANAAIFSE